MGDKAFNIDKNHKYDGYQRGNDSLVYTFFNKTFSLSGAKSETMPSQELAEE